MGALRLNQILQFLIGLSLILIISVSAETANGSEQPVTEDQTIVFTTIFPQSMSFFSKMSDIYKEAFGRLGYGFKLISQPGERAMIDANQGIVDGEAGRIIDIEKEKYPNLIRVPESIVTMQDGAYAIDDSIKIEGWKSLTGKPYVVGLLKGIKSVEKKLPFYVDRNQIVTISKIEQGIEMLKAKRIDLFIVGTQVEEFSIMKDVKCAGIVETKILYPWLHKRHKHLVQPLAETLKAVKSEGVY